MNITEEIGTDLVPETTGAPVSAPILGYGQVPKPQKPPIPIPFTGTDAKFALLALVCGYFFIWLIHPFALGFGVTLFTFCFCAVTLLYQKRRNLSVPKQSYIWLTLTLLSSLNFSIFSNIYLQFLNFLFLMCCAVYWVAVLTSGRIEKSLGNYFLPDMINQFFKVPFGNFGCAAKIIKESSAKNKKSKVMLASLCGALAIIPLVCIVTALLIQADEAFQTVMQQITAVIGQQFVNFLLRLLPAFLVGSYLFGLLYGNIEKRGTDRITAEKALSFSQRCKKFPAAASITALCILCAVYLLFFGTQTVSLFSAFLNQRPDGITYAEYARRGFFELCQIVFINLGVMAVSAAFTAQGDREHKIMRVVNVVLSVQTLLLIATAISKMIMYIDRYGLTQKRVYTSCFMIMLFLVFCIIILAQFKKIPFTKSIVLSFIIGFLILCYANVDGIIAKYNIDRYQNGTLQTLDVMMLYQAPDASKPYALELYQQVKDSKVKGELREFLQGQNKNYGPFQEMSLQQFWARSHDIK